MVEVLYRQNTNIEKMYVYASERSERSYNSLAFLQFLNCYFFQYFVGTSDTLSVQMICVSAYMYRQISKYTDRSPENHPTLLTKVRHFVWNHFKHSVDLCASDSFPRGAGGAAWITFVNYKECPPCTFRFAIGAYMNNNDAACMTAHLVCIINESDPPNEFSAQTQFFAWREICIMTRILNNDSNRCCWLEVFWWLEKNRYDSKIDSWLEIGIMTGILNYDSKNRYDSKFWIVTRNSTLLLEFWYWTWNMTPNLILEYHDSKLETRRLEIL